MEIQLTQAEIDKINRQIALEGDTIISAGLLPGDWLIGKKPGPTSKKKPRNFRKEKVSMSSHASA